MGALTPTVGATGTAVWLDNAIDIDASGTLTRAAVQVSSGGDASDVLAVSGLPSGLLASFDATSLTLTLSGEGSADDYQTALRQVHLSTSDNTPNPRTVTWSVTDTASVTASQNSAVQVCAAPRTLYVDQADAVVLNGPRAAELLDFCRANGVAELVLYNSSTLVAGGNAAALATFMAQARQEGSGIERIGFAVSHTAQIEELKAFVGAHSVPVDFLMSEYEFWVGNSQYSYAGYKDLLAAMNAASVALGGSDTYTYLGWVAGDLPAVDRLEAETTRSAEIAGLVDRVYLAAYNMFLNQFATNGQNLYDIAQGDTVRRLQDLGAAAAENNRVLTVVPIVSAEFAGPDTWGSGYWLSHHGLASLESEFAADYAADAANGAWKSGLNLNEGYAYFGYSHLREALTAPFAKVFFTSAGSVALTDTGNGVDSSVVVHDASMLSEGLGSEAGLGQMGVTYSKSGADAALFTLNSATGELRFSQTTTVATPLDAGSDGEYQLTLRVTSNADADQFAIQAVNVKLLPANIDLQGTLNGIDYSNWYLVNVALADGRTWYALSTDGNQTHDAADRISYDVLTTLLGVDTGSSAAVTQRSVSLTTAGGTSVNLAIASVGVDSPDLRLYPGTALGSTTGHSSGSAASNAIYDGLLAVWDAHNGTSTTTESVGTPNGWQDGFYWSADKQATGHHFVVGIGSGYVTSHADSASNYVAFQVL